MIKWANVKNFFSNCAEVVKVGETLTNISTKLEKLDDINTQLQSVSQDVAHLKENITSLQHDMEAVKGGLQSELLQSLTTLAEKVEHKHFADSQDRASAEKYYKEILALGKDGFAHGLWEQIIQYPYRSKEEYLTSSRKK